MGPLPQATLSSSLLSRLHLVPQTPSTVVAMEVARVQPLPLLTATSNFLDRSLKPTTPTSREQPQTTRIASYDLSSLNPVASITGYNNLPPNDQDAIMAHIANVGPLAISVAANPFKDYHGGVFSGCP